MKNLLQTIKENEKRFDKDFIILDEPNMREDEVIDFFKYLTQKVIPLKDKIKSHIN